ncbi:MAG: nucleotide sugar dehydrogenase [Fimbriimonas sp.]|nr:nucleotide sugar dehydrogenase [Fimbriimonas sp.]
MADSAANQERICVVGLGYVGLPVAVAFGQKGLDVVGFDVSRHRIEKLRSGFDSTGEFDAETLGECGVRFTADPSDLDGRTFFIVTVPTPIDNNRQPDLSALQSASKTVGAHLTLGACVVYESTVYPGVTEDVCRPILAQSSGLVAGVDFTVGYSPERINPGDRQHMLSTIVKVVSGEDNKTLERVASVYGLIIDAGVHRASTIKVAEAAKVIENTQRDVNIALMNELALIFGRLGIATHEVLEAAGTKWNFLKFTPGFVGGHCIGVDPYYLTARSEQMGYHPEVILAGRRINDRMGRYVAQSVVKALVARRQNLDSVSVAILGFTFKENVPDIRNTRVIDVVLELREYGIEPLVYDPIADFHGVEEEYGLKLCPLESLEKVDAVIVAVPHRAIRDQLDQLFERCLKSDGLLYDVKSAVAPDRIPEGVTLLTL